MKNVIVLLALIFTFAACNKDTDNQAQEEERSALKTQFTEIQRLSHSKECVDASEWSFVGYGSKPCGNIAGYISYHKEIDTEAFLKKVEAYTTAEKAYNKKWGLSSSCSVEPIPTGVTCKDEKPVLTY